MEQNYISKLDWKIDDSEWNQISFGDPKLLINDWDLFDEWAESFLEQNSDTKSEKQQKI